MWLAKSIHISTLNMIQPYFETPLIRLFHGDARDVLPRIEKGLVVTDPPYNLGYHYASYKDNLPQDDYYRILRDVCPLPCVLIHYMESLCNLSITLNGPPEKVVAWVYPSNTQRQWRGIAWWGCKPDFTKDGQDYKNPTDKRVAKLIESGRRARLYDWWEINQVKNVSEEKTPHPCQIPMALMTRLLRITESDLVVDPFAGSGTTLVAAQSLGRQAVGVEMDESYCEIIAKRLRKALG